MQDQDFWALVAEVRQAGQGDFDAMEGELQSRLEAMDAESVAAFDRHMNKRMGEAYTWPLWAAAYIIQGGCSDDGFMDFRSCLVFLGQAAFEAAVKDPDSLAGQDDEVLEALYHEGLLYVSTSVYESKSQGASPPAEAGPAEPSGQGWDEDDEESLKTLCPRLYERFW